MLSLKSHPTALMKTGMALLLAASLAACASSGVVGEASTSGGQVSDEKVDVQNRVLAQKLKISNISSRAVGGILQAQVTIENRFSSSQEFQYRFAWFDATGFEVEAEGEQWVPLVLHGKEMKTLQAVAPNPGVKSFKIVIRGL